VQTRAEASIVCNEAGIERNINDEQESNISASIRVSFDLGSNVNEESEWQKAKQCSQRISTEAGTQIDCKAAQP
jgi:hypothetical protein